MTLEQMIREMVKNGVSTEDVARQTQDALNSIEKMEKAKREKEKAIQEDRKNYLDQLKKEFSQHCMERFTLRDVGVLAAIVVAPDCPKWTVDDIKAFIDIVVQSLELQANCVGWGNSCKNCKQEKKEKYDPGEAFLDRVINMLDRWAE